MPIIRSDMTLKHTNRGFYKFLDYGYKCSTIIMVTTNNFWRNFDSLKEKEHFASTKIDQFRPFKENQMFNKNFLKY